MCIKHYYISKKISRPWSAELGSKTVFLWKNWKKSIFVQFWGTIKNEVFPTSKPHKMTKNDFFIKKKIPPRYYAYINHQKNFQSGLTSESAGLRKNMRDPPLPTRFGVRFFILHNLRARKQYKMDLFQKCPKKFEGLKLTNY